jgi:hypothetical protein
VVRESQAGDRVVYRGSRAEGRELPGAVTEVRTLMGVRSVIVLLDNGTTVTTVEQCVEVQP